MYVRCDHSPELARRNENVNTVETVLNDSIKEVEFTEMKV